MIPTSSSLLAPLLVGSKRTGRGAPSFGNALLAAAESIPKTYAPGLFRPGGFMRSRQADGDLTYLVHRVTGDRAGDHDILIAFFRKPGPKARAAGLPPVEYWCLGYRGWTRDPVGWFDGATRVGVLETVRVRMGRNGFEGAPELALMRHGWLSVLRAADPDLMILGGEDRWDDAWTRPLHQVSTDN